MAILVFRLNDVPDDEADAIRTLLNEHHINFYETSAGKWGFSVAGIWLHDNADKSRARELIDAYQADRSNQSQADYHAMQAAGDTDTLLTRFKREPLRFIFYTLFIIFILYITLVPFLGMGVS